VHNDYLIKLFTSFLVALNYMAKKESDSDWLWNTIGKSWNCGTRFEDNFFLFFLEFLFGLLLFARLLDVLLVPWWIIYEFYRI